MHVSLKDYLNPTQPPRNQELLHMLESLTPPEERVTVEQLYMAKAHQGRHARA